MRRCFVPNGAGQILVIMFLSTSMAAWWFAVWLSIGRREQTIIPLFGAIFGFAMPMMIADQLVMAGYGEWQGVGVVLWMILPLAIIAHLPVGFLKMNLR
jgi:hypothetical protein